MRISKNSRQSALISLQEICPNSPTIATIVAISDKPLEMNNFRVEVVWKDTNPEDGEEYIVENKGQMSCWLR